MDKLQWFKFSYADWRMGKIQRCPEITQARFLNLCCLYWSKESSLSIEDAIIEIDKEHLDILINKKIVEIEDDYIVIKFLDEQLLDILNTSKEKKQSGKLGNLKRWHKELYDKVMRNEISVNDAYDIVKQSHTDRTPIAKQSQSIAEKIREEEIREDKKKKETKPTAFANEQEFLEFFNKAQEIAFGKKGTHKILSDVTSRNFAKLNKTYTREEFKTAIMNCAKSDYVRKSNNFKPLHFCRVDVFGGYLNQVSIKPMAQGLIEGN
jgi:hypothetical protein